MTQPSDRVIVRDHGTGFVEVRCPVCGVHENVSTDPTHAMLEAIQAFMARHSSCDVIDLTDP